jgi:rRNA small subunit pseudouridine methyltransferase Nep1
MAEKRKFEATTSDAGDGLSAQEASDKITYESPDAIRGEEDAKCPVEKIPRLKLSKAAKNNQQRLIVVLEKANLEIVKVGKAFELITCDEHMSLIRKYKKDPAFCRPDITHQCLLMLFDSPLNRAGLLQVYIHTRQNVLIDVNPQTRFPRTFKRFANLMVQLLYKLSIRSSQGSEKLLRVIKNPITLHLPPGCRKIGTSFQAEKLVHPRELVPAEDSPLVVVIGAQAHGPADVDYTEESFSISQYPLSAALACTKIVSAFEEAWGIH